jgi:hypothetical protein
MSENSALSLMVWAKRRAVLLDNLETLRSWLREGVRAAAWMDDEICGRATNHQLDMFEHDEKTDEGLVGRIEKKIAALASVSTETEAAKDETPEYSEAMR